MPFSAQKAVLYAIFILFSGALSAQAMAAPCYTDIEFEADQGLRIHSELMVIGLNCQHLGKRYGQNLYGDYRKLTADHADLFAGYERTMMEFFKKQGASNPEAKLNDLRTRYANKISDDAAKMRPDIFCSRYAPRIEQAKAMSRNDLKKWAATPFPQHPVSHKACKK